MVARWDEGPLLQRPIGQIQAVHDEAGWIPGTRAGGPAREAAWSPDGTRIVFARAIGKTYNPEIYAMKSDGTNVVGGWPDVPDRPGRSALPLAPAVGDGVLHG